MKKQTLKSLLLNYLKDNVGWVHKGELEEFSKSKGFLAETGNRILRHLAEEGTIDHREYKGSVQYAYEKQPRTKLVMQIVEKEDGTRIAVQKEVVEYV